MRGTIGPNRTFVHSAADGQSQPKADPLSAAQVRRLLMQVGR